MFIISRKIVRLVNNLRKDYPEFGLVVIRILKKSMLVILQEEVSHERKSTLCINCRLVLSIISYIFLYLNQVLRTCYGCNITKYFINLFLAEAAL